MTIYNTRRRIERLRELGFEGHVLQNLALSHPGDFARMLEGASNGGIERLRELGFEGHELQDLAFSHPAAFAWMLYAASYRGVERLCQLGFEDPELRGLALKHPVAFAVILRGASHGGLGILLDLGIFFSPREAGSTEPVVVGEQERVAAMRDIMLTQPDVLINMLDNIDTVMSILGRSSWSVANITRGLELLYHNKGSSSLDRPNNATAIIAEIFQCMKMDKCIIRANNTQIGLPPELLSQYILPYLRPQDLFSLTLTMFQRQHLHQMPHLRTIFRENISSAQLQEPVTMLPPAVPQEPPSVLRASSSSSTAHRGPQASPANPTSQHVDRLAQSKRTSPEGPQR